MEYIDQHQAYSSCAIECETRKRCFGVSCLMKKRLCAGCVQTEKSRHVVIAGGKDKHSSGDRTLEITIDTADRPESKTKNYKGFHIEGSDAGSHLNRGSYYYADKSKREYANNHAHVYPVPPRNSAGAMVSNKRYSANAGWYANKMGANRRYAQGAYVEHQSNGYMVQNPRYIDSQYHLDNMNGAGVYYGQRGGHHVHLEEAELNGKVEDSDEDSGSHESYEHRINNRRHSMDQFRRYDLNKRENEEKYSHELDEAALSKEDDVEHGAQLEMAEISKQDSNRHEMELAEAEVSKKDNVEEGEQAEEREIYKQDNEQHEAQLREVEISKQDIEKHEMEKQEAEVYQQDNEKQDVQLEEAEVSRQDEVKVEQAEVSKQEEKRHEVKVEQAEVSKQEEEKHEMQVEQAEVSKQEEERHEVEKQEVEVSKQDVEKQEVKLEEAEASKQETEQQEVKLEEAEVSKQEAAQQEVNVEKMEVSKQEEKTHQASLETAEISKQEFQKHEVALNEGVFKQDNEKYGEKLNEGELSAESEEKHEETGEDTFKQEEEKQENVEVKVAEAEVSKQDEEKQEVQVEEAEKNVADVELSKQEIEKHELKVEQSEVSKQQEEKYKVKLEQAEVSKQEEVKQEVKLETAEVSQQEEENKEVKVDESKQENHELELQEAEVSKQEGEIEGGSDEDEKREEELEEAEITKQENEKHEVELKEAEVSKQETEKHEAVLQEAEISKQHNEKHEFQLQEGNDERRDEKLHEMELSKEDNEREHLEEAEQNHGYDEEHERAELLKENKQNYEAGAEDHRLESGALFKEHNMRHEANKYNSEQEMENYGHESSHNEKNWAERYSNRRQTSNKHLWQNSKQQGSKLGQGSQLEQVSNIGELEDSNQFGLHNEYKYLKETSSVCLKNPCGLNSQCHANSGRAVCTCALGFYGNPFTECKAGECQRHTDCPSYLTCSKNRCINICATSCGINAICLMVDHEATCSCPPGFTGNAKFNCRLIEAVDQCIPNPCGANTQCRIVASRPHCQCLLNYIGDPQIGCRRECEHDFECSKDRSCIDNRCQDSCKLCGRYAICESVAVHKPVCKCPPDYFGNPYAVCKPECVTHADCPASKAVCYQFKCRNPCEGACGTLAQCEVHGITAVCSCPKHLTGNPLILCRPYEWKDFCEPNPCGRNARCELSIDDKGAYVPVCKCLPGFYNLGTGDCVPGDCADDRHCPSHKSCENFLCEDACKNQCGKGSKCEAMNHTAICSCPPGYKGNPTIECFKDTKKPCTILRFCPYQPSNVDVS